MNVLQLDATKSSPHLHFDPHSGRLAIGGESYPENADEFFSPILEWTDEFLAQSGPPAHLEVTLVYMNTSSTRYMVELLDRLESAHQAGRPVSVSWVVDAENARAHDTVEELKEDFDMPFEVVAGEYPDQ